MKKAYIKDIIREIKRTRKRYISIIAIVILGVAFYAGINASSPDMLDTYNKYINDYNMYDLNFISTVGFEKEDLKTIESIEKINNIEASKSANLITVKDEKEKVINIMSMQKEISENTINKIELIDGTYPSKEDEIILDNKLSEEYKIGDTIEFICRDKDIKDILNTVKYKVVGFANSPLYIQLSRGNTNLGDGTIYGFAVVLEDAFSMEQYTNVYAKVKTENKNRTSDEYINEIEQIQNKIEEKTDELSKNKYNKLYKEATEKIQEAKEQVQNAKDKIKNTENEILKAKNDLENAQDNLEIKKQSYRKQIDEYESEIQQAESTLLSTEVTLSEKQKEITKNIDTVKIEEQKLIDAENKILNETGFTDLSKYLEYLNSISVPDEAMLNIKKIIDGKSEIEKQKQTLKEYQKELDNAKEEYNKGIDKLNQEKQTLESSKKTAESNFVLAENKINRGWKQLKENQAKFEQEKENGLKEIEEAENEIKNSEKELQDLKVNIYVLNLETNEGYVSYKSDSQAVATIGKVFPIIFFLVAALVSLTAMTRMVEENRGSIGTYKSLGYSRVKIASKYLIYAISATALGIVLGTIIGSYTLPWVISEAYSSILYKTMPTVIMKINMQYALTAGVAAFLSTTIATIFACYKILRETPAKLMRPTSPKEGKKILLEKIPFIWNHFSFIKKITARNVFRYKKRLYMTVIGIAGCTALIFTGFGLKDSISSIVDKQYKEIKKYDFEIALKNELDDKKTEELDSFIKKIREDQRHIYLRQQNNEVISEKGKEQNVYVVAVENQKEFENFVTLQDRKTKTKVNLSNEGVVITEKISKLLNVDIGDEITIKTDEETTKKVKVTGIAENYLYHYIYMNKSVYEKIFNESLINNHIYLSTQEDLSNELQEEFSRKLLDDDNISQVVRISSINDSFKDMLGSLNMVVAVLIICAGLLAFVVLYNLNSINIEERKRELATIKLLGFYNNELSSYVFRENIVLTLIGALVGLIFGVYLLGFIITTAEMDMVMFGRETSILSYILAFLMTIIFTILINLVMNKELKKINMIESLKSVE